MVARVPLVRGRLPALDKCDLQYGNLSIQYPFITHRVSLAG